MQLSVITVCFNCKKYIKATLESIICQKNVEFEYIIIDGASTDGTLDIIKQYFHKIKNIQLYSEKDDGIYDAMNKGVLKSNGDYIFFLNAGDTFDKEDVLERVSNYLTTKKDLYYGKIRKGNEIELYPPFLRKNYFILREKMICHQAIFVKREYLQKFPFDTTFYICADRDWLLKILANGVSTCYMKEIIVCNYDCSGVSSSNYIIYCRESERIAKKYSGIMAIIFIKIKRLIGKKLIYKRKCYEKKSKGEK